MKTCTMPVEDRLKFIAYELREIYGGRVKFHTILNMLVRPLGWKSWKKRKLELSAVSLPITTLKGSE